MLALIFLLSFGLPSAICFSSGAPSFVSICRSMTPFHGQNPQSTPCPYSITLNKNTVDGGGLVRVTLEILDKNTVAVENKTEGQTKTPPFRGFLAMVRKVTNINGKGFDIELDSEKVPQGKFIKEVRDNSTSPVLADITDCFGRSSSSVTHSNSEDKRKVSFDWQAPNVNGNYVISVTFVQSRPVFWVEQPSDLIKVKRVLQDMRDVQEDSTIIPGTTRVVSIANEFFKHIQFYVDKIQTRIGEMI